MMTELIFSLLHCDGAVMELFYIMAHCVREEKGNQL